jgi:murein DD-endopeptidase MepM/ murein hydrolase activator NlpD
LGACATTSNVAPEDKIGLRQIVVPGQKNIERKGADLYYERTGKKPGYGTFSRHVDPVFTDKSNAGMDLDISKDNLVYPMASGLIVRREFGQKGGNVIIISHGIWYSCYAHLEEPLVSSGRTVTRKDRIAIGGATGAGASGSRAHLHIGIATMPKIADLMNLDWDLGSDNSAYFNPVDFAAFKGIRDSNGNLTLPYWYGEENDGPLDELCQQHQRDKLQYFRRVMTRLPYTDVIEFQRTKKGAGAEVPFLYQRIKDRNSPFTPEETQNILDNIINFLSFQLLLTAPKRNPFMPELYKS